MRWFRRRSSRFVFAFLLPFSLASAAFAIGQAPEAQPPAAKPPAAQPAAEQPADAQPPVDAEDTAAPAEGKGKAKEPERPKFVIPDEPKTIDPAQFEPLIPPKLAAKATAAFEGASLREVVEWLNGQGIPTLLDESGLEEAAITSDAPIDDRLTDEPVYFLLDRLDSLDLDWYLDDGIVHLTSRESADERMTTLSHNVGDLYDAGYDGSTLIDLITSMIDPESWPEFGGTGSASIRGLGDVLFVSQSQRNHRQILGLLAALRKHGRMTYIAEPPQHEVLRTALREKIVSAEFRGTRLEQAMNDLATQAGVAIRLDETGLEEVAMTRRSPVDLTLKETRLATTLEAIVSDMDLDWILKGGAIVITSRETADVETKTAVFDVRDLTIDDRERSALIDAITSTLDPESWPEFGGTGNASIRMPKLGVLVVSQSERNLAAVADLLSRYREAITLSKPRKPRDEKDPNEVITVYYRMPKQMAHELATGLPALVEPGTWNKAENDELRGKVIEIASSPDMTAGLSEALAARSTLIVTHTRATHEKIEKTIRRITNGDQQATPMAMGMGGFGGGLPADAAPSAPAQSGGGMGGMGGGFGGF